MIVDIKQTLKFGLFFLYAMKISVRDYSHVVGLMAWKMYIVNSSLRAFAFTKNVVIMQNLFFGSVLTIYQVTDCSTYIAGASQLFSIRATVHFNLLFN